MDIRNNAPEIDALRQGMDWDCEDIERYQILIETVYGDSHPGSTHLDRLAKMADDGIKYHGAKPSHFTATDICDGIAQGHDGMNYSLASREIIAAMCEIHAKANGFDGAVFISSCDKAVPAHLMAMARLNLPSVFVPGGTMPFAANGFTLEQIGNVNARFKTGELTREQFTQYQKDACTSCGACQFMGTACTMQVMAEALGLALPHSALMPANMKYINNMAKAAGKTVVELVKKNLHARDILTEKAFHNAVVIHGAIGGSTNALLHIPVIAREAGLEVKADLFDELHRKVPFLVDTRPVGKYSTDMFWYAGGVPALMMKLKDLLYLDALTVTGKTVGENLEYIEKNGLLEQYKGYLCNFGVTPEDVIHEISPQGAIAILKGNIAKSGAVVKYTGLPKNMRLFRGKAKVFDDELSARNAILEKRIKPGDCIIIRYCGPRGSGMPEMFYTTESLCASSELVATTAILTDGRFSGASKGPCIGHISPEAAQGGEIGLVRDGDIIEIDIENRSLNAIGVDFEKRREENKNIINEKTAENKTECGGILSLYRKYASNAIDGGYMS